MGACANKPRFSDAFSGTPFRSPKAGPKSHHGTLYELLGGFYLNRFNFHRAMATGSLSRFYQRKMSLYKHYFGTVLV